MAMGQNLSPKDHRFACCSFSYCQVFWYRFDMFGPIAKWGLPWSWSVCLCFVAIGRSFWTKHDISQITSQKKKKTTSPPPKKKKTFLLGHSFKQHAPPNHPNHAPLLSSRDDALRQARHLEGLFVQKLLLDADDSLGRDGTAPVFGCLEKWV